MVPAGHWASVTPSGLSHFGRSGTAGPGPRVVPQDREVDLLQRGRRVQAKLVGEVVAEIVVGGQCLRLPARGGEGAHEQGTGPLG